MAPLLSHPFPPTAIIKANRPTFVGRLLFAKNVWAAIERRLSVCYYVFMNNTKQVIPMELPKRKQKRLTEYDYSTPNAYFVTICTKNRKNLFWTDVGAAIGRPYNLDGN